MISKRGFLLGAIAGVVAEAAHRLLPSVVASPSTRRRCIEYLETPLFRDGDMMYNGIVVREVVSLPDNAKMAEEGWRYVDDGPGERVFYRSMANDGHRAERSDDQPVLPRCERSNKRRVAGAMGLEELAMDA